MGKKAERFGLDLEKYVKDSESRAEKLFRTITLEIDQGVVLATPVDKGGARRNWLPAVNVPRKEIIEDTDKEGNKVLKEVLSTVGRAKLGDILYLNNNLPYINRLENGYSKQAPNGMVTVNLLRVAGKYGGIVKL